MRKILATAIALLYTCAATATGLFDIVTKGSADRSVTVDIIDSTDGTPETGVVFNTSGIALWYRREGAAKVDITEATLAALTTAHTDGGFLHVSDGTYRVDMPDAAFATAANYVDFGGTVTGMIVIGGRVRLVDYSLEDAVRGTAGTALPNAVAGASTGLLVNGSNSGTVTLAALTVTGATTHTGATVHTGAVSMAAGLTITQSTSNTAALSITGNGTGNGATFTSGSGATGNGVSATAASTNGNGFATQGTGTGSGNLNTGGATGHGARYVGGSTSGNGISTAFTAPSSGAPELGFNVSGTLSGTHSTTTADLGTNAPGTVSDVVGHTLDFPTRHVSRSISSYDTATGIATFAAIDSDITLTNADPWLLYATSPASGGGGDATEAKQDTILSRLGTPSDLGSGATLAANNADIEGQTDDIGVAGAGLTAADDAVMTRLGASAGASIAADIAAMKVDTAAILVDTGTTLDGKLDTIDTVADAIKAKTDQLIFGVTNTLNVNVEYMNAIQVLGSGTVASPWNGE